MSARARGRTLAAAAGLAVGLAVSALLIWFAYRTLHHLG